MGDMGWMVHQVCHGKQTVCDPPSVSPVLSHCSPCMAEYRQPSQLARGGPVLHSQCMQVKQTLLHSTYTVWPTFTHAGPPPSAPPSIPSSPSSQSGSPTADKCPTTEMETLTAAQQGMVCHAKFDPPQNAPPPLEPKQQPNWFPQEPIWLL